MNHVASGSECTTFSLAASGHYRDAANLFGFAGLKRKKLAKVKSANIQARHSWIILKACKAARIPCSLENPAGSWLFKLPDGGGNGKSAQAEEMERKKTMMSQVAARRLKHVTFATLADANPKKEDSVKCFNEH